MKGAIQADREIEDRRVTVPHKIAKVSFKMKKPKKFEK